MCVCVCGGVLQLWGCPVVRSGLVVVFTLGHRSGTTLVTLVAATRRKRFASVLGSATWLVRACRRSCRVAPAPSVFRNHCPCPKTRMKMPMARGRFFAGLDFTGTPFDQALRFLLTSAGFFLPGEAQKINRITQVWSGTQN